MAFMKAKIKKVFARNEDSKTHSRHIDRDKCREAGLDVIDLDKDKELQDIVLTIHHCCMILSENTAASKIVENNIGGCFIVHSQAPMPIPHPIKP